MKANRKSHPSITMDDLKAPVSHAGLAGGEDSLASAKESPTNYAAIPEVPPLRRSLSKDDQAYDLADAKSCRHPDNIFSGSEKQHTILYLAYGSNLAERVFRGRRGIRPLAAINVVVPELVMTFDLPGIPYNEPCFANTAYRSLDNGTPIPKDPEVRKLGRPRQHPPYSNPQWRKGMVGVVYEVTPLDYQHIIATEGGGTAYQDVLVDCYPLAKDDPVVPVSPSTEVFKAHTLNAGSGFGRKLRPDPNYAQPSLRYINLLRDGADEHGFPAEYKGYLHDLQPYTVTSQKQAVGAFVFQILWLPFLKLIFALTARYADEKGRNPPWLSALSESIFEAVWISYDGMFYRIFGDGERTQGHGDNIDSSKKQIPD